MPLLISYASLTARLGFDFLLTSTTVLIQTTTLIDQVNHPLPEGDARTLKRPEYLRSIPTQ
jgi:hypothetical protein